MNKLAALIAIVVFISEAGWCSGDNDRCQNGMRPIIAKIVRTDNGNPVPLEEPATPTKVSFSNGVALVSRPRDGQIDVFLPNGNEPYATLGTGVSVGIFLKVVPEGVTLYREWNGIGSHSTASQTIFNAVACEGDLVMMVVKLQEEWRECIGKHTEPGGDRGEAGGGWCEKLGAVTESNNLELKIRLDGALAGGRIPMPSEAEKSLLDSFLSYKWFRELDLEFGKAKERISKVAPENPSFN